MERIAWVAAVRAGVGELVHDRQILDEARRPAVGEQQWTRRRADPANVNEMHAAAIDVSAVLREGVEFGFARQPIVRAPPRHELAQSSGTRTVAPIVDHRVAQTNTREARAEVSTNGSVAMRNGSMSIVTVISYRW